MDLRADRQWRDERRASLLAGLGLAESIVSCHHTTGTLWVDGSGSWFRSAPRDERVRFAGNGIGPDADDDRARCCNGDADDDRSAIIGFTIHDHHDHVVIRGHGNIRISVWHGQRENRERRKTERCAATKWVADADDHRDRRDRGSRPCRVLDRSFASTTGTSTTVTGMDPTAPDRTPRRWSDRRLPRNLHPVAWWIWAAGLVVAASRTTNPLLLLVIVSVAGVVVSARRSDAPWARAFRYYLVFGAVIIAMRVGSRIIFGGGIDVGGHVLFRLPVVPLPQWAAGIRLGGAVTLEAVLAAAYDGLRLATLIVCIGAANALANPKRALRALPGALYELGVAVVISITVAPQLITSIQRVRRARKLRGGSQKGFKALRSIALPVLQDALDRSLMLAAAMDSRGYGRRAAVSDNQRRATSALLIGGLLALCFGSYGLFGGGTSGAAVVPAMVVGVVLCAAGITLGSRRVRHTDYRPDPWGLPENLVAGAGLATALVFGLVGRYDATNLNPSLSPLAWPTLPIIPLIGVVIAASPAVTAPPPPIGLKWSTTRHAGHAADSTLGPKDTVPA